jgi:hypothetical protein
VLGVSQSHGPQPHPLATIAWNNLNHQIYDEDKVIKEITDKIKTCPCPCADQEVMESK